MSCEIFFCIKVLFKYSASFVWYHTLQHMAKFLSPIFILIVFGFYLIDLFLSFSSLIAALILLPFTSSITAVFMVDVSKVSFVNDLKAQKIQSVLIFDLRCI